MPRARKQDAGLPGKVSFHLEYRKCKPGKCKSCDAGGRHGPYWYAVYRDGNMIVKRYAGRQPWIQALRHVR